MPPSKRAADGTSKTAAKTTTEKENAISGEIRCVGASVLAACSASLKEGLSVQGAPLPVTQARRLAELVQQATRGRWLPANADIAQATAATSPPPPERGVLSEAASSWGVRFKALFEALSKIDLSAEAIATAGRAGGAIGPRAAGAVALLADMEVGLLLVGILVDVRAACEKTLVADDTGCEQAAMHFVSCVTRALFAPTGTSAGAVAMAPASLLAALSGVWRSVHHALAAVRYVMTPLARRAVPLASHCLAGGAKDQPPAVAAVSGAAADLLVAAVGQGEASLQELAAEELVSACAPMALLGGTSSAAPGTTATDAEGGDGGAAPPSKAPRGSRRGGGREGPSFRTATLLRAVSAACLPTRCCDDPAKLEELRQQAHARNEAAEALATRVTTGVLRSCLLSTQRESESWGRLEAMVKELLRCCPDPRWAAAQPLLLALTRGLARVVDASRSVDMPWAHREFAVRQLGAIAGVLCQESALAADYTSGAKDVEALERWTGTTKTTRSGPPTPAKERSEEGEQLGAGELIKRHRLILDFLEADVPLPVAAQGCLETAVVPADHPASNSALLLCCWGVGCSDDPAAARKGGRGRRAKAAAAGGRGAKTRGGCKGSTAAAGEGEAKAEAKDGAKAARGSGLCPRAWALAAWTSRCRLQAAGGTKASRRSSELTRFETTLACAARLYRQGSGQEAAAPLARARSLALNTMIRQLQVSPLVYVRRQAMVGLSGATSADRRLLLSRNVAEALAVALRDDSALVRSAAVDFIGRAVGGQGRSASPLEPQHVGELRAAARAGLADTAPAVRRAAFRVVCDTLAPEDPQLTTSAAELLRRTRGETPQVRGPVLAALEQVVLAPPLGARALAQLAQLASDRGIAEGVRDLIATHQRSRDPSVFAESTKRLVEGAVGIVSATVLATETPAPADAGAPSAVAAAAVLEQIAIECPEALHERVKTLQAWLAPTATAQGDAALLVQACRILADILPSWAQRVPTEQQRKISGGLLKTLKPLLESERCAVTRGSVECICCLATHDNQGREEALAQFGRSMQWLTETVERSSQLDVTAMKDLCRHAWILGTTLEFLDVDEPSAARSTVALPGGRAAIVSRVLTALCLKGPAVLRSRLVPCLGFLLRRHLQLLKEEYPGPADALRAGLLAQAEAPFRASTMEAFAALLKSYQAAAEAAAPTGNETSSDRAAAARVSEAVQRLATLQPEILGVLYEADAAPVAEHAIQALQSMSQLGVLHPAPAMASLVTASLAGFRTASEAAGRLLSRLTSAAPQQLLGRLGAAVRDAATSLRAARAASGTSSCQEKAPEPGNAAREGWRFAALAAVSSEHLDGKRLREQLLEVLLAELAALANPGEASKPSGGNFEATLECGELLLGILAVLPYRSELEIAQIVAATAKLLTLRAMPLLTEVAGAAVTSPPRQQRPASCRQEVFGTAVAAVLLHGFCQRVCSGPSELQRLCAAGSDAAAEERPLAPGFSRRLAAVTESTLVPLLQELARAASTTTAGGDPDATTPEAALLALLAARVPLDSCLLQGQGAHLLAQKKRKDNGRSAMAEAGGGHQRQPAKRRRSMGKEAQASAADGSAEGVQKRALAAMAGA